MPSLQLQIQGDSGNFAFDVEAPPEPSLRWEYKSNANPPEPAQVRAEWTFRGARLVSSDGTSTTFWTEWAAFLARFDRGSSFPTYVRLVRDPSGDNSVVWTLGPGDYEQFRVDSVEGTDDPEIPEAAWNVLAPVNIQFSAVKKQADADGIVFLDQRVVRTYTAGGLDDLEWVTRVETKEGVNAETKAKTFGLIPLASTLGPSYSYQTNGPDGVDVELPDADERTTGIGSAAQASARTPTVAIATCRVRQWGIDVGVTGPGTSPTNFLKSVRTDSKDGERRTTTTASAEGPGAESWVKNQAPVGKINESSLVVNATDRSATGTWVRTQDAAQVSNNDQRLIICTLSGGGQDFDLQPVMGGFDPITQDGPILHYQLTVDVDLTKEGALVTKADLKLPGHPGLPWRFKSALSSETDPYLDRPGVSVDGNLWRRRATLVYLSASKPGPDLIGPVRSAPPVATYSELAPVSGTRTA